MHIRSSSPNSSLFENSEESSAIKIQAGFRGYRVRRRLHHKQKRSWNTNSISFEDHSKLLMEESRENENLISSSNINETNTGDIENLSATKIQAGIRGFLARRKQKLAADAATKIQASFRGFKARKQLQVLKLE